MALFGVFDGHGLAGRYASVYACSRVAAYIKEAFPKGCGSKLSKEEVTNKIKRAFDNAHKDMMESVVECEFASFDADSTATAATAICSPSLLYSSR